MAIPNIFEFRPGCCATQEHKVGGEIFRYPVVVCVKFTQGRIRLAPSNSVESQETKYVERWPSTTSAWAGWSRFNIPVDRYGGVHSLLRWPSRTLGSLTCHWAIASRIKYLLSKISKSGQGHHSVYSVVESYDCIHCTLYTVDCRLQYKLPA